MASLPIGHGFRGCSDFLGPQIYSSQEFLPQGLTNLQLFSTVKITSIDCETESATYSSKVNNYAFY